MTQLPALMDSLETLLPLLNSGKIDGEKAKEVVTTASSVLPLSGPDDAGHWARYLEITRRRNFLLSLPGYEDRLLWTETALSAIKKAGYTLARMLADRVHAHPNRTLFLGPGGPEGERWSYSQIERRLREVAAFFYSLTSESPRVALMFENSLDGACCDLACLTHDIYVVPLSPHIGPDSLARIFDETDINIAVADTEDVLVRLQAVARKREKPLALVVLDDAADLARDDIRVLGEGCAAQSPQMVTSLLLRKSPIPLEKTCTVLYTSGSTGEQKGVAFSMLNLVFKRFARAAALPFVGEDELLVSFLPLYHTFGRYLEMLGMIFWGGTYVFAGNPSFESLVTRMKEMSPTGLISIPARWRQLRDACLSRIDQAAGEKDEQKTVREVVGSRLRWGLSAAGALEPSVFRFFERHGIALCSGFGMTEATGGITMTPPMKYEDGTVGIALPGVQLRLTEEGELQISGAYIARYVEDPEPAPGEETWISTGDIFRMRPSGYYDIIDRVKDIYKNTRGRTIAPRRVEGKFDGVPGIKRTFLAGDGRDDNVLLIVPDLDDTVVGGSAKSEAARTYYEKMVSAANEDLAPFERVVNFAILDRDFDLEKGELTPKGSYRRKAIEKNFETVIASLYRAKAVDLMAGGLSLRLPRWIFRDLAVLEGDITGTPEGLVDRRRGKFLPMGQGSEKGQIRIGNFQYFVSGSRVDLGVFAHQPLLWLGNDPLADFLAVKDGWDVDPGAVSPSVSVPAIGSPALSRSVARISSQRLSGLHRAFLELLFGPVETALERLREFSRQMHDVDRKTASAIRRRIQALATHPELDVRAEGYKILLLEELAPESPDVLAAFLKSGKPFLTRKSIEDIARADLRSERLVALRRRLAVYREGLVPPISSETSAVFDGILSLLVSFVQHHPDYYGAVRAELASWVLQKADRGLALRAEVLYDNLTRWFETYAAAHSEFVTREEMRKKLACHEGVEEDEMMHIATVLADPVFLKESVFLAFDGENLDLSDVPPGGIWVLPLAALHNHRLYRVAVNTRSGKHFDLVLIIRNDLDRSVVRATNFWMLVLSGSPWGTPIVPGFGCSRPELGALSLAYVSDLTVAERLRDEMSRKAEAAGTPREAPEVRLRSLFIRALAPFFTAWKVSGHKIIPGAVSPANVVVPAEAFRERSAILSLSGWRACDGPWSLVRPMQRNFFDETAGFYPRSRNRLRISWIFEAAIEGLGRDEGLAFLSDLRANVLELSPPEVPPDFVAELDAFVEKLRAGFRPPLDLELAINHFQDWEQRNSGASPRARASAVQQIYLLYRLDHHPSIARYFLYRHTYFAGFEDGVRQAFDRLLHVLAEKPHLRASQLVELFEVQESLDDPFDRGVFSQLVFPGAHFARPVEMFLVGEENKHVVFETAISDRLGAVYKVREPVEPAEIGQIYRLSLRAGVPRALSERHQYLVVLDSAERVAGGLSFIAEEKDMVRLDGIVLSPSLRNRGLSQTLLRDFCSRLKGQGIKTVTTNFALATVPFGPEFRIDRKWGGLVCTLETPEDDVTRESV